MSPTSGSSFPCSTFKAYRAGSRLALALPHWVAVATTVTAVLLLTGREQLHALARRIELKEIIIAGEFLILTGIILPLLPNDAGDDADQDHAAAGLARPGRGLHFFLCELSGAALLGGRGARTVDGGARRPLFVDGGDRRAGATGEGQSGARAPSPRRASRSPPASCICGSRQSSRSSI